MLGTDTGTDVAQGDHDAAVGHLPGGVGHQHGPPPAGDLLALETTTDLGAFTRAEGGVTVEFAVNPTLTTSATYPPASAQCAGPQNTTTTEATNTDTSIETETPSEGSLASTGANNATAAAAFGMVVVGAGAVLLSRRRSRSR